MRHIRTFLFVALLLGLTSWLAVTDNDGGPSLWRRWTLRATAANRNPRLLRLIDTIDVPGPKGKRFDYLTIDYGDHWLLSAHLGAGILYVIDTRTDRLVKAIPGVPGVEGVTFIPGSRKAYTSDWFENAIGVVDLNTGEVVKKVPTESKPDGSAYAEPFHKLYVSDERGRAEAVLDTRSDAILKTLRFDSETGMPQYDPVAKKVYVNLQDDNELAEIDPATDAITGKYHVERCKGNHGMALDVEHRRAFLSCEDNDQLVVFGLDTHQTLAAMPMAAGPDVVAFDPGLGLVYVACGSGSISVFKEDDPDHFRKLGDAPVQRKVHSLAVDKDTHRVYAPEQEENGHAAARIAVYEPVSANASNR